MEILYSEFDTRCCFPDHGRRPAASQCDGVRSARVDHSQTIPMTHTTHTRPTANPLPRPTGDGSRWRLVPEPRSTSRG